MPQSDHACSLALPSSPRAQEPSAKFGENVTVSEVLLDALVTDRDGNVIVGLGPDDFIVEEQGKPMPVTSVSFYSNRRFLDAPESAGISSEPAPIPEERFLIFMFEDQREASMESNGLLARQLDAGRQLKAWVRMKMLSSDGPQS